MFKAFLVGLNPKHENRKDTNQITARKSKLQDRMFGMNLASPAAPAAVARTSSCHCGCPTKIQHEYQESRSKLGRLQVSLKDALKKLDAVKAEESHSHKILRDSLQDIEDAVHDYNTKLKNLKEDETQDHMVSQPVPVERVGTTEVHVVHELPATIEIKKLQDRIDLDKMSVDALHAHLRVVEQAIDKAGLKVEKLRKKEKELKNEVDELGKRMYREKVGQWQMYAYGAGV